MIRHQMDRMHARIVQRQQRQKLARTSLMRTSDVNKNGDGRCAFDTLWPSPRHAPHPAPSSLSHHHSTASTAESNRRSQVSTIAPLSVDNHPTSCRTTPPLWSAQSPPLNHPPWSTSARSVASEDSSKALKDGGSLFPSFRARWSVGSTSAVSVDGAPTGQSLDNLAALASMSKVQDNDDLLNGEITRTEVPSSIVEVSVIAASLMKSEESRGMPHRALYAAQFWRNSGAILAQFWGNSAQLF